MNVTGAVSQWMAWIHQNVGSRLSRIIALDAIAILCIVTYHIALIFRGTPANSPWYYTLAIFGLSLFTFTSGYKFMHNHANHIVDRAFLPTYFRKRFVRLMKPYYGYSLLVLLPTALVLYLSKNVLKMSIEGRYSEFFGSFNIEGLVGFVFGNNFIAGQLWYLVALLAMTAVCFLCLYFFTVRSIFYLSAFIVLIDLLLATQLRSFNLLVFQLVIYLPFFCFGLMYAFLEPTKSMLTRYATALLGALFIPLFCFFSLFGIGQLPIGLDILVLGSTFIGFAWITASAVLGLVYIREFALFLGYFSFPLYLLHAPIISEVFSVVGFLMLRLTGVLLFLFAVPLTIGTSLVIYWFLRWSGINRIFE